MQVSKSFKSFSILNLAIIIGLFAFGLGYGLLQTFYKAGVLTNNTGRFLQSVAIHELLNAFIITTFFFVVFGQTIITFYYKKEPAKKQMWGSFIFMAVGFILLTTSIFFANNAPNQTHHPLSNSHPLFYIGSSLFIIGSWIPVLSWFKQWRNYKSRNLLQQTPLAVLGVLINGIIWLTGTVGFVLYNLFALITDGTSGVITNLSITTLAYFSHTLVYVWLVPVFIIFYTILPAVAGGKLYSDFTGRILFFSLLLISFPLGIYQINQQPETGQTVSFLSDWYNYGIIIIAGVTAYILAASMEYAGKKNGASKGLFSWLERLPYFDETKYLFVYFISALALFIVGGLAVFIGLIQGWNNTNYNTTWQSANLHLIIGGPVFLSIAGISLYLYSKLSGKKIIWPKLNITVPYLWVMGMIIFSFGFSWGGLLGLPSGVNTGINYLNPDSERFRSDWVQSTTLALLGGLIMFIAGLIFIVIFFGTMLRKPTENAVLDIPVAASLQTKKSLPLLEKPKSWLVAITLLITTVYLPPLLNKKNYQSIPIVTNNTIPVIKPAKQQSQHQPLSITKDYGLLLAFLASVGIFILILLFCVQASGLQRKLRTQKSSFPG